MKQLKPIISWESLNDSPAEFEAAIKNAVTANERDFFTRVRYKILCETAFSNDVLMFDSDNDEGIYILRCRFDDFLIGKVAKDGSENVPPEEYGGLFLLLEADLFTFIGRHITVGEWLRERDYQGVRYDANNDLS